MHNITHSPLGRTMPYPDQYDAGLLFAIERAAARAHLPWGAANPQPFTGADWWTGYELSWLGPRGKPQVAIVHILVPCDSPNIIESKSLKLYLGSFNQSTFASADEVCQRISTDLNAAVWGRVAPSSRVHVQLIAPDQWQAQSLQPLDGLLLDRLDVECQHYEPAPELLAHDPHADPTPVTETLVSHLLKSNCPVTGQPDWASVQIHYLGQPIDQARLLQYIVSFRTHSGFHEHCVERIFADIWMRCRPLKLSVYARYTRRGGLDINPWRTSFPSKLPPNIRTPRQ